MSTPINTPKWFASFDALGNHTMQLEETVWAYLHGQMMTKPQPAALTTMTVSNPQQAKWALSSAWQKSIRRGYTKAACLCARTYVSIDAGAFWRRLPVVVIEDIGIADPMLVTAIIWISGKKAKRAQLGTDMAWAHCLTRLMAQSVKDRTCCDLVVCAESDPDLAPFRKQAFSTNRTEGLRTFAADPEQYLVKRMIALWALGGTKRYRGGGDLPKKQAGHDPELEAYFGSEPYPYTFIAYQGGNKTQDAMPLAWGLLYELARYGNYTDVLNDEVPSLMTITTKLPPHSMIQGLPSYCFDMHTWLGKKALGYMASSCAPIRQFLEQDCGITDYEAKRDTLGGIMFRVDSALLDRRLIYEDSETVYDLCETARWRCRGIPMDKILNARLLAEANLDWFDYARRYVVGLTSPSQPIPAWSWKGCSAKAD